MSTQRRVVRWQRPSNTRLAGAENPSSLDAGASGQQQEFRRVAFGLTASASTFWCVELATNSLSFNSCCEWRFCHWNSSRTAFQKANLAFSPPIRCLRAETGLQFLFRLFHAVGLAAGPSGYSSRDGKATWPRKFVSPARRTKRGLRFWKTISSQRFTTSVKMNIPSRDRFKIGRAHV